MSNAMAIRHAAAYAAFKNEVPILKSELRSASKQ